MMPPANQPPVIIDERYRVERLLGAGGMGAVYACKHTGTRRACAVKVILADAARKPQALERFMREASAQGAVKSPNVVDIFDVGLDRATGNAFMAMELLSGEDLGKRIETRGKLAPDLVLRIAAQGLTGLVAAHEAGVVHRDLKPANLFLARTGKGEHTVKLLDFGIAKVLEDDSPHSGKLTRTGMVFGSPAYMSPEQASGSGNVDHRSDIWSFGAVMYEALSGAPPYHDATSLQDLITRIWRDPPEHLSTRAPDVPAEVAAVVARAMTHKVDGRYQSAAEMREAVLRLLPAGSAITSEMLGEPETAPAGGAASSTSAPGTPAGGTSIAGAPAAAQASSVGGSGTVPAGALESGGSSSGRAGTSSEAAPSQGALASGTQPMPSPVGGSTQGAFARTGETAPGRRWVAMGAITLLLAAAFAALFLKLVPKDDSKGGAVSGEPGNTAPSASAPSLTTTASASAPDPDAGPASATPPATTPPSTADAGTPAPPATTSVTAAPAVPPPGGPGTRPVIAKPKSTDPFSGKPISKDNKP
jgi:serine/threonine-protein kinase